MVRYEEALTGEETSSKGEKNCELVGVSTRLFFFLKNGEDFLLIHW